MDSEPDCKKGEYKIVTENDDQKPDAIVDTNYEVGQDNIQPFGLDIHNPVFLISSVGTVIFVALAMIFPDRANDTFMAVRKFFEEGFDWAFMWGANLFVIFCVILLVTPLGKVRLGGPEARPEFTYFGWFGMLFAAGMGIGLMFFGVLEPVYHFQNPPLGFEGSTEETRTLGIAATIFHWGLHPWAIYAVVALSLAFFSFNYGLPLTLRSAFFPILGDRVWGWFGHIIDVLAVFATLFGLATSLGFGAEQAAGGMNYVTDNIFGMANPIPATNVTLVTLILAITGLALISVLRGIDGGVKILSEINLVVAGILLLFVIIFGATLDIFASIFTSTIGYVQYVWPLSNSFGREDLGFMHGWTTFYWAWWISWSPFVGMFIARVSYGRTVREFVFCVLVVPTIAGIVWMNAMGGFAIDQFLNDGYTGVTDMVSAWTPELTIYAMLEPLPLNALTSIVAIILVIVFFVTSSDSGSLVIDTITSGGKTDAPVIQRVFWVLFEGLVAIALLIGGGIGALQAAAISSGFPFTLVLLAMMGCTGYALNLERHKY